MVQPGERPQACGLGPRQGIGLGAGNAAVGSALLSETPGGHGQPLGCPAGGDDRSGITDRPVLASGAVSTNPQARNRKNALHWR